MKPIKIYILEDEIIIQQLLKETLETLAYNVCGTQTNAEIALHEIEVLQPDIVFLDIKVEGSKTGIWLGNQLEMPIIYLSAFSNVKTFIETIEIKPVSFLGKPFNIKELFIALQLALNVVALKKELLIKACN
ncbi:response regulator [Polaribacter sp. Q13]|uniref:response regulator n=1 Tax=Polaribacter sp. Q13 TaxID=2806551 RepID=UPI00193AFFA5|nr:response regulator [Polaribacter sp. Q13]QVY64269.1 response regulator [Polaribacter sp. Q13]